MNARKDTAGCRKLQAVSLHRLVSAGKPRNVGGVASRRVGANCRRRRAEAMRRPMGRRQSAIAYRSISPFAPEHRNSPSRRRKPPPVWPQELRDGGLHRDDRRRRPRRRRRAEKRRRQNADAPHRHGRAAGGRGNRPAVRLESSHEGRARRDSRRDARLRTRHAHDEPGRRGPLPGQPSRQRGPAR